MPSELEYDVQNLYFYNTINIYTKRENKPNLHLEIE